MVLFSVLNVVIKLIAHLCKKVCFDTKVAKKMRCFTYLSSSNRKLYVKCYTFLQKIYN